MRLLIILVVGLVLLGPDKLPSCARQAGSAWKTLRELQQRVEGELRNVVPDLPRTEDIARYARSPVSLLNRLADQVTDGDGAADAASPQDTERPDPVGEAQEAADYTAPAHDAAGRDADRPGVAWGDPSLN